MKLERRILTKTEKWVLKIFDKKEFISGDEIYLSLSKQSGDEMNLGFCEGIYKILNNLFEAGYLARYKLDKSQEDEGIKSAVDQRCPELVYSKVDLDKIYR